MSSRSAKMMAFVNWRMRVTISDSRVLVGTFLAFDKHMNIVLGDCEEIRRTKSKKEEKEKQESRQLGLVLLRGENVIHMQAESQPPPPKRTEMAGKGGPGMGRAAGRGVLQTPMAMAPQGLQGPVRGLGGPAPSMMMPMMSGAPVPYGRGAPMPPTGGRGMPPPPAAMMAAMGGRGMPPPPPQMGFPPQMAMGGRGMPPNMMPPMGRGMPPPPPPQMMMMGRGMPPPPPPQQ
jgi:small nuclear ribonucleoprotein B and B'